jgi:hypothetical protein
MMGYEERARRRGAISMRMFLDEMERLGFVECEMPRDGALHEFTHRDTPGRCYVMPAGRGYAPTLVQLRDELQAGREWCHAASG